MREVGICRRRWPRWSCGAPSQVSTTLRGSAASPHTSSVGSHMREGRGVHRNRRRRPYWFCRCRPSCDLILRGAFQPKSPRSRACCRIIVLIGRGSGFGLRPRAGSTSSRSLAAVSGRHAPVKRCKEVSHAAKVPMRCRCSRGERLATPRLGGVGGGGWVLSS